MRLHVGKAEVRHSGVGTRVDTGVVWTLAVGSWPACLLSKCGGGRASLARVVPGLPVYTCVRVHASCMHACVYECMWAVILQDRAQAIHPPAPRACGCCLGAPALALMAAATPLLSLRPSLTAVGLCPCPMHRGTRLLQVFVPLGIRRCPAVHGTGPMRSCA